MKNWMIIIPKWDKLEKYKNRSLIIPATENIVRKMYIKNFNIYSISL